MTTDLAPPNEVFNFLHAVGTPSPRCRSVLATLPDVLKRVGSGVPITVSTSPDDAGCTVEPDDGLLLVAFVDAPGCALMAVESCDVAAEADVALRQWHECATRLLELARRRPDRCILVDVASLSHSYADAQALLLELGLSYADPDAGQHTLVERWEDDVQTILADRVAAADPVLDELYEELRLSCRLPIAAPSPLLDRSDILTAWAGYRQRQASQDELELRAAKARLMAQEQDLLVAQIRQLEEMVTWLQAKASKAEGLLRAEILQLKQQLQAREAEAAPLQALRVEVGQLKQQVQSRSTEVAQWQSLASGREAALDQCRAQVRAHLLGMRHAQQCLSVDGLRMLGRVDTGDHRQLDFSIDTLEVGARSFSGLRFRLIEHLGRPGLVVFAVSDGTAPLGQWQSHGEEAGCSLMLLVPSEERGDAVLRRMGTSDWQLVRVLVRAVAVELAGQQGESVPGWRANVARLERQLDALPASLRYDAVTAKPVLEEPGRAVDITFVNALYGERPLGELSLRCGPWQHGGKVQLAVFLSADGLSPALASWPAQPGGVLLPSYLLPVGQGWSARAWAGVPPGDRALILALLDALPGAVLQIPPNVLPSGWTPEAMSDTARQLNRATRRSETVLKARRVAGRFWPRHSQAR